MRKLTVDDLTIMINYWLTKAYGITLNEVPVDIQKSGEFFRIYKVSQELHDEWIIWAKKYIKKKTKTSNAFIDKAFVWLYLDLSPSIIKDDEIQSEV